MSVFRIVYLGTPDFAAAPLRFLLQDEHFEVALVVTQPDRPAGRSMKLQVGPVRQVALDHDIPVLSPESINEPSVIQAIREARCDAAVVVAFGQILGPEFLKLFPLRAVNIHASLLPLWRGAAPIQRALMNGDAESGVSLQVVVPKLDAGPVIGVRRLALPEEMTAPDLYEALKPLSCDLLGVDFVDYLRGNLTPVVQDEARVTIAKKIKKEDGLIQWERPAREILNRYRGLAAWPGSWTVRDGKTMKVFGLGVESTSGVAGTVLQADGAGVVVATGEGALRIRELQPESRKRQTVAEYLKGYPLKRGDRFG